MGVGNDGRWEVQTAFISRFIVNNSFSMKKTKKKVHSSYPSNFPILHGSQKMFITIGTIIKKKNGS